MRTGLLTVAAVLLYAGAAQAQGRFTYKPIDTERLLVQPGDTASGAAASTTTSVFRTVTRTLADTIENNGFVRTVNNLLGRREQPGTVQAGLSPLPLPSSYMSTRYKNTGVAQMPIAVPFGQTPNVTLPASPTGR
jgi:hypothetical protein